MAQSTDSGLSQEGKALRAPVPSPSRSQAWIPGQCSFSSAMPGSLGVGLAEKVLLSHNRVLYLNLHCHEYLLPALHASPGLTGTHTVASMGLPKGKENGEATSPSHTDLQYECSPAAEVTTATTLLRVSGQGLCDRLAALAGGAHQPSFKLSRLTECWPLPSTVLCIRVSRGP